MNKHAKIIAGVIIFAAIIALPYLYNLGKSNTGPNINLNTPGIQKLVTKQCIESTDYMKANHMKLLLQWRDDAVRKGNKIYVNSQGKSFDKSIDTCLKCHYDPNAKASDQFCVSCHDYASVKPDCRKCHPWPGEINHPRIQ